MFDENTESEHDNRISASRPSKSNWGRILFDSEALVKREKGYAEQHVSSTEEWLLFDPLLQRKVAKKLRHLDEVETSCGSKQPWRAGDGAASTHNLILET